MPPKLDLYVVDRFDEAEVAGLPEIVQRYLRSSIAPGTPLVRGVRLSMRGRIHVGRWLRFQATEILDPHRGFVWQAQVAHRLIDGSDSYVDGHGSMQWRMFGAFRLMSGTGHDISRSAAGRAGAEAVFSPIALLPRFGVEWRSDSPRSAVACWSLDSTPIELRCWFDDEARLRMVSFDRWGDPAGTGDWDWHEFGGELSGHRTFGSLTIPATGRLGWGRPGTGEWFEREFFRYEITALEPRAWADRTSLPGTLAIDIRPIEPTDADALARFHAGLSIDTTRLRYFSPHPTLSTFELRHLTQVDHHDREALIALVGSEIVGVARYERLGSGTEAEVAFVVADPMHHHGIGSTLLVRLVERARAEGVTRLVADTMFENRAMIDVFEHSGLPADRSIDHGVVHYGLAV